jgi:hypothetical protein
VLIPTDGSFSIFSAAVSFFGLPNVGQDMIEEDDERFKAYHEEHGYKHKRHGYKKIPRGGIHGNALRQSRFVMLRAQEED